MSDHAHSHGPVDVNTPFWKRMDKALLVILLIPVLLAIFDFPQLLPTVVFAGQAILHTGVFIIFAVVLPQCLGLDRYGFRP